MPIRFTALPTATVAAWRGGGADAYGLPPERVAASSGEGTPCRHCLRQVPAGAPYLILAARPFIGLNPFTETGPIFLCAGDCPRGGGAAPPAAILTAPDYIVRGYDAGERIVYGTGGVVATAAIAARAAALLDRAEVAFVHVRSASNNCFLVRVDRGG